MEDNNHDRKTMTQPGADLLIPVVNHDPEGKPIYHPAIGKGAFWGGLIGGVLVGVLAWLMASGVWAVEGLGQIASASPGSATFFGFVIGSAAGGLIGSLNGLRYMLLNRERYPPEP